VARTRIEFVGKNPPAEGDVKNGVKVCNLSCRVPVFVGTDLQIALLDAAMHFLWVHEFISADKLREQLDVFKIGSTCMFIFLARCSDT